MWGSPRRGKYAWQAPEPPIGSGCRSCSCSARFHLPRHTMSTATESPTTAEAARKYLNFDEFIDYQLGKTQSRIKSTDLLTAAVAVGAIVIGYLLLFVVLDQWIVPGGLSFTARVVMLTLVAGSALGVFIWK